MKRYRWMCVCFLFLLFANQQFLTAQQTPPKQTYLVRLEACHLNPDNIGRGEKGGDPEVRIIVDDQLVYTSISKYPQATGTDYRFDDTFEISYTPGAKVTVMLLDRDPLSNDTVLEITTTSLNSANELFTKQLEQEGSWISLQRIFEPGRYLIRLERSFIAPDDYTAIGGKGTPKPLEIKQLHLIPYYYNLESFGNEIYAGLSDNFEQVNPKILVSQNGKIIFDSSRLKKPIGCVVGDWNLEFELNWESADNIAIMFEDIDLTGNDRIFTATSNTDTSISLFMEPIYGGKQKQSFLLFSVRKLKDR